MYCPRCDRTIKEERLEELDNELKKKFNKDSIERGKCPVCDAPLLRLKKEAQ
jgi:ssDNA-binding Zn-finger/Zn-ribbon topoisomerase 1